MSWSFTVNGSVQEFVLPVALVERMATVHIMYPYDMQLALGMAKNAGLKSATCTGIRTPNPYGGAEVIDISVRGTVDAVDFNEMIKSLIASGPEEGSPGSL
jgi:hypothetical protein